MSRVKRPSLVEKRVSRFLREPPSVRTTASVVVGATVAVVLVGGVLMRWLDHQEYPNVWIGMWWALQTVTSVGYGDVTPENVSGRIVAAFVILEGIALLTVLIAAITSTFVARANEERGIAQTADEDAAKVRVDARLESIERNLEGLEKMLRATLLSDRRQGT